MLDAKEYIKNDGFPCPFCGSDNIESGTDTDIESGIVTIPVSCNSCGHDWGEEYHLVGYSHWEGRVKLEEIDDPRPERDQLREQVRILREVANQIVLEDEQIPGIIPADIVAGARAALATKEGA